MYLKSSADLRMAQSKYRKNSKGGAPGYVDTLNIKASLRNLNITSTGLKSCSSCHNIGHHGFGKSDVFNKDMKWFCCPMCLAKEGVKMKYDWRDRQPDFATVDMGHLPDALKECLPQVFKFLEEKNLLNKTLHEFSREEIFDLIYNLHMIFKSIEPEAFMIFHREVIDDWFYKKYEKPFTKEEEEKIDDEEIDDPIPF
jgi:hypothetical protein